MVQQRDYQKDREDCCHVFDSRAVICFYSPCLMYHRLIFLVSFSPTMYEKVNRPPSVS